MGRSVKAVMDRGELVGDDVMIGIVRERLNRADVKAGFVLDGFPRTVAQATALDRMMEGRDPLIVVDIVVPEAELVRRLSSRLICEDCGGNADAVDKGAAAAEQVIVQGGAVADAVVRVQIEPRRCRRCGGHLVQRTDDDNAVVVERLKVYQRATKPLVDFYSGRATFRAINGMQPTDSVAADLVAAIEAVGNGGNGTRGMLR
jgi:adenylate kinase